MKSYYRVLAMVAIVAGLIFGACGKEESSDGSSINANNGSEQPSVGGFDENGASNALFSVSANQKVRFSRGNLQYQATTHKWRFAEEQYAVNGEDNMNISSTYDGWIDLFGWGTGNNPTNASTNKEEYDEFHEWGDNAIINGGNRANMWRTLTATEVQYLFETRPNAAGRYGVANIEGVRGLILLPDNWVNPAGVHEFVPGITRNVTTWDNNQYTIEEWSLMENAGAILLPAAGIRSGTQVNSLWNQGRYWSSTRCPIIGDEVHSYRAHTLTFSDHDLLPIEGFDIYKGFSVRLVMDAQ